MTNPVSPSPAAAATISVPSVLAGVTLVILLGALEQTIVAVALPAIATQLHGFSMMAWVVSAYLVASTVVTPIYGKLSDIYGRRATLTSAVLIFLIASIGCALAETMPQLIAWRVLQGIGGGGLISVAQATIADVVPLRERGRYQGYISSIWAVASLGGPVIGGYLTNYLSWHWIFWINLPIGLVALAVIRRALRSLPAGHARREIDYVGALLFAVGLTALLIAITRVGQGVSFADTTNIALLIGSAVVLAWFGWYEKRIAEPIIPLGMFRNRTVAICCATLFLAFFQMISMSVLLPLRLQLTGGVAPDAAALRLLPLTLAVPLGAFLAGRLMTGTGRYKPLQIGGAIATSIAIICLAFTESHHAWLMGTVMCVLGLGIGFQLPTGLVATQNAVPPSEVGLATALTAFSRMLGGAVGVAVLTSILIAFLRDALPETNTIGVEMLMDLFHSVNASVLDAHGAQVREAASSAFRNLFIICAAISLLSPLLASMLREQELRGKVQSVAPAK
ncbi:MAG: putative transporter, family [Burkholderia sp.]|nr:putative transporter, family [Burkholderia sp.]